MDVRKHTEAYATSFESSFSSSVADCIRTGRIFENETEIFSQVYNCCKSFFLTDNEYARKLSPRQRSFAEVLVRIIGSLVNCSDEIVPSQKATEQVKRQFEALFAGQDKDGVGKKLLEFIQRVFFQFSGKSVIKLDDVTELATKLTRKETRGRFAECVRELFSDIDSCIATYVAEEKPVVPEKKTLSRDVLYTLQETLGFLWAYKDDDEANAQTRRIVKLLKSYGVNIEWPELDLRESNERFFVVVDSDIKEPCVYKPYLYSDSICLQGEMSVPEKND